jgi:hypothetical protein
MWWNEAAKEMNDAELAEIEIEQIRKLIDEP